VPLPEPVVEVVPVIRVALVVLVAGVLVASRVIQSQGPLVVLVVVVEPQVAQ